MMLKANGYRFYKIRFHKIEHNIEISHDAKGKKGIGDLIPKSFFFNSLQSRHYFAWSNEIKHMYN